MIRDIQSFRDAEVAVRELDDKLSNLLSRNLDLKGRRIMNTGKALEDGDCINLRMLINAIDQVRAEISQIRADISRIDRRLIDNGI